MKIHTTMRCLLSIFAVLCSLLFSPLKAQTGRFYSTDNELSSSLINELFQDSDGYIWIATEYGLNKFDGMRFTSYRCIPDDATSLKDNYVRTLFESKKKTLFVGCINGLLRYERETDNFREIPLLRGGIQVFPHVLQVYELQNGEVWVATSGQGVFRLADDGKTAVSVEAVMQQGNFNYLNQICEDTYKQIWIGTDNSGLICYRPETGKLTLYEYPGTGGNIISSIVEDKRGNLFVGTQKEGLFRFDKSKQRFVAVPYEQNTLLSVYCLAWVDGRLLIGTDGEGVKIYNDRADRVEDYPINSAPVDLSKGKVHAILEDRDKNLWVGLFQKGIALMPKQENRFEYYGSKSVHYNPIGVGCVMSIYQDSKRSLWIGTDNEGVYELNAQGMRLRHIKPDKESMANTVMCVYEDSEETLWLGTYTRGLARLNRRTGTCDYPLPIQNERIFSITEDRHKNLYIATFGSGFYRYNLATKELEHYESSKDETGDLSRNELANDWLNYIFCDSEGMVWLGHYKGISCFNPLNKSFVNYRGVNTLITGRVGYALQEDSAGRIWAATADGLYCFDKKKDELRRFSTEDGLPNNVICGICEDEQRNIWISTYMGICKYNTQQDRFFSYYAGDGLQGNEFTHGAFYKDTTGKVYFGGINGITAFYPSAINDAPRNYKVWITDFYISNQPVHKNTLSGNRPVVYTAVPDADLFQLSYRDNTFSLVFSTLQYNNPEQISYQYRIPELSEQWSNTEPGVNRVTYNNLTPGRYTFHVRVLHQGNESEVRTIKILISPPWYQAWWAYAIYACLLFLLLLGIINYILSRMRHRREIMKREHAEQINEAKLQFFINISHEIRTPMTLIINPLEKLMAENKGKEIQNTYLMIYRNAQRILRLINQLMDIRKLDKGQVFLKFRETDMVGFIKDVMLTFDYLANKKQIRFTFTHAMPQLKVWVDMNNFDKVLMNIFSNAFKYTPEKGEISVSLSTGEDSSRKDALRDYCEITITDNGIGLDKEKVEQIFERFYQINNDVTKSNFGTGIGLHLSRSLVELHHGRIWAENREDTSGSRFVIRIPLGCAHLRTDELEQTDGMLAPPVAVASSELAPINELLDGESAESGKTTEKQRKRLARILIIEDEEEIRAYLKQELEDEYKILLAKDGKEGYDLLLTDTPDLVISDVMMPGMDGLTLCRKVKQNANVNHVPVVLLTARSKPEDTLEGMATGADAYIVKPFNTELLRSTVANLLVNRKLLRNKFSGAQQQQDKIEKLSMKSSDEILMNKIMKVINENLSNSDLSVEMLAEHVGLSRVHVHRKLKELTNLSTRDFIRNVRLQQAATLLRENKLTVSEVAYAIGYTNLSHFSTSFRDLYGMSPKEYMQSGKQQDATEPAD